jgi:hypothetical protein
LALGLKEFAKDAEPDKVAEAFEVAKEGHKSMGCDADVDLEIPKKVKEADAPPDPGAGAGDKEERMLAILEKLVPVLEKIAANEGAAPLAPAAKEPEEQLDEFVKAYGGKETPEEEQEEAGQDAGPDEKIGLKGAGETPFLDSESEIPSVMSGKDLPENPIPGATTSASDRKAMIRDAVAVMKPVIAAIPDRATKQKAVDALIGSLKRHQSRPPAVSTQSHMDYGKLLSMKSAKDSKAEEPENTDSGKTGENIRAKYHRKLY